MKKGKEIKQILIALSPIMTQTFPVISGDGNGYSAPRNDSVPIIGPESQTSVGLSMGVFNVI
jgi:hypothetical protein